MNQNIVTIADGDGNLNRDDFFEAVRDGQLAEAKASFGQGLTSSMLIPTVRHPCSRQLHAESS